MKRWRVFFWYKGKLFKKTEFKKKGIKKIKRSNKKGKEVNTKTWWTKTRSDEKRTEEKTCKKVKHKKTKEIQFFKYGRVLEKNRIKRRQNLTLKKIKKKGRSLHEENCMILSDCEGQGQKHFQKRKVKHEMKNFLRKWRENVKKRERIFFQKRCYKKRK